MQQAALLDGLGFYLLSPIQNCFCPAEIDIGGGEVTQALVVAVMILGVDEGRDRFFESPGQVVVLKKNSVLQGLMPALVLVLVLWVPVRAADVIHALVCEPVGQFVEDVAAAIIAEQPGPVDDGGSVAARGDQGIC